MFLLTGNWMVSSGCRVVQTTREPSVEFTLLPASAEGNPDKIFAIAGKVERAQPGQRLVLFAKSGLWWVQPTASNPFTELRPDSTWVSETHPGSSYAALLVTREFRPPASTWDLPVKGGAVLAVKVAEGVRVAEGKTLRFSGYEWQIREASSDRGGTRNQFDATNAWTDKNGFLHLRIDKKEDKWTSAEVSLTRSLDYGSYLVTIRDVSHLEPAVVFSAFTWDDSGAAREMDIEIGRWGEPTSKNAQYVVQPYYVPANSYRFNAPPGVLTFSLHWEPRRVEFKASRGSSIISSHDFSSGVPVPGNETFRLNLYVFDNKRNKLQKSCEVIVENFEYLP